MIYTQYELDEIEQAKRTRAAQCPPKIRFHTLHVLGYHNHSVALQVSVSDQRIKIYVHKGELSRVQLHMGLGRWMFDHTFCVWEEGGFWVAGADRWPEDGLWLGNTTEGA